MDLSFKILIWVLVSLIILYYIIYIYVCAVKILSRCAPSASGKFLCFFLGCVFWLFTQKKKKKPFAFTKLWMTNGLGPIRVFTVAQPRTHWTRIARSNRRFSKILEKLGSSLKKQESSLTRPDRGDKQLLEFARKHLKNPPRIYKYTNHSFLTNTKSQVSL